MSDVGNITRIERLKFWCQRIIPLVYDDSLSYYELLCKVVEKLNDLITNQHGIVADIIGMNKDISELQSDVVWLKNELQAIADGKYVDVYIQALAKWINDNLQQIVARIAKQVFFGLTLDGYFVAYIPESWSDIEFDTIMTCGDPNWGRLVLEY